jgi:hypothetical protein
VRRNEQRFKKELTMLGVMLALAIITAIINPQLPQRGQPATTTSATSR